MKKMIYERYEREHIILFIAAMALVIILIKSILTPASSAPAISDKIQETNLAGLRVMDSQSPKAVTYEDGITEYYPDSFIGLFINGSIIENANIFLENDRALGPLKLISEKLGAVSAWDAVSQSITITDNDIRIELAIGEKIAKLNGVTMSIDAAPRIINDYAYVPIRFVAESLNCNVAWFDGKAVDEEGAAGVSKPRYIFRMRQIMVSRYPVEVKPLNSVEAVRKVKEQLILAYEKRFGGKFQPLTVMPETRNVKDSLRYAITTLSVTAENDRFFIMPMIWEFMIDKYTGTVYIFNSGETQTIDRFDPASPGVLDFAVRV